MVAFSRLRYLLKPWTRIGGPPVDYQSAIERLTITSHHRVPVFIHVGGGFMLEQGRLSCWTFSVLITEPLMSKLLKVAQGFVLV